MSNSANNTFTNSIIQGNGYGVYMSSSTNNILANNTMQSNGVGVRLDSSTNNILANNTIQGSGVGGTGVYLISSNNNILTSNTVQDNKGAYGVYIESSTSNTFINNIIQRNSYPHGWSGGGNGVYLSGSDNNIFENNTIQDNGPCRWCWKGTGGGVYLSGSNGNSFTNSTIQRNGGGWGNIGYGIYMSNSNNNTFTNIISQNNAGGNMDGPNPSGSGYGVYLDSSNSNTFTDSTIQGNVGGSSSGYFTSSGSGFGVYLGSSTDNIFINNTIQNNIGAKCCQWSGDGYGVRLDSSTNNTLAKNTIQNNPDHGVYLYSSTSNLIYNNYFNNSNNFITSSSTNIWNITKTPSTNIVGGPYLGGNFWANPSGTGFSQTCTDVNNGICNIPYTLDGSNIDYLPLSMNFILDAIPPTTTVTLSGTLGNNGWYTSDVQATLNATDNEGGSGVKITEYSFDGINWIPYNLPFSITNEGMTMVFYKSTDNADNVESLKNQTVKIDKTPPTITGAPTTSPNANGWYNADVVVHFTSSDEVSGIDAVTPDTTLSTEGVNLFAIGTATDMAGNINSTTVSGISIDKTQPHVTINTPANGGIYILNQTLIADWSAIDSLSGLTSATGTLPNGAAIDTSIVGTKTFTVVAMDNADNTATQTSSYTIAYNFLGILPPIREDGSSVFKLGGTIPVKFRIADASGNYASTAVANITYQKITDEILGTVEEPVSISEANEGNTFRYDNINNYYIFNLGTTGMDIGTYQLNINLDDGTIKTVRISLK